ncbi:amidohydrolase family protein [Paraburkholderia sp. 5N]|uniref:Amidohydrolase family protein n=1 Tax=Paraburkholderia elongata TaxID=2675747 RepID=A0A972NX71_9BURK|nr:amidohydrolase family protein [Paraburkholderia elongata]
MYDHFGQRLLLNRCGCCNPSIHAPVSEKRRGFLTGVAEVALSAAAIGTGCLSRAFAQAPAIVKSGLVDVHHHHIPPFYLAENRERITASFGGKLTPAWNTWAPEHAITAMDGSGVGTAILSLTTPGVWFGDAQQARKTARRVNEYAADLGRTYPGRFGLFAALPLPDQEGSLREIEYAFDVLQANGIGLLTSYGDRWLGDAAYRPVFEELDRRKAVVFVHPTVPFCCRTLLANVPPVVDEIPQDTARAIANLLYTGSFSRYRNVRFIFTHAGGTMPMMYGRMLEFPPANLAEKSPNGIEYELRRLYYDIADTAFAPAIAALTSLVPTAQILFGSDNPYAPLAETVHRMRQLGLSDADLRAIGRENALALLPRLKQ